MIWCDVNAFGELTGLLEGQSWNFVLNPAAQHGKSEFCWKDTVSKLHALAQGIIRPNLGLQAKLQAST